MTTPLLQYVARFDGGGEIVTNPGIIAKVKAINISVFVNILIIMGLEEKVTRRVGRGSPCLSNFRLYLFRQAASD